MDYTGDLITDYLRYLNKECDNLQVVQIGAMDGLSFDDIRGHLQNYRWNEVLVEPIPDLFEKLKNEIDEKIFDLTSDWGNLDTRVQVIDVSQFGRLGEDYGVDIFVNIDEQGTMDFQMFEEGTDNEIQVNDTIEAAYFEAQSNYESSDLLGYLRG